MEELAGEVGDGAGIELRAFEGAGHGHLERLAFEAGEEWFGHREDGSLRTVLAEVNNTFGERHAYLLSGDTLGWGREVQARKVFHVSPFCAVEGGYRFRFMRTGQQGQERTVVRVDHDDDEGPLIRTSVSGQLQPITPQALRQVLILNKLRSCQRLLRVSTRLGRS